MAEVGLKSKKRKLSINENTCCFCLKVFQEEKHTSLNIKTFDTLLGVCRQKCDDDTSAFLLENENEIRYGNLKVKYHKSCRSAFVHPHYISDKKPSEKTSELITETCAEKFTRSRDSNPNFDWKQCCFICGERCLQKKRSTWSLVQSSTDTSSSMYQKVLEAAKQTNDQTVLKRLFSVNGDLVAAEARYHRSKNCLALYLRKSNCETLNDNTSEKENFEKVLDILKDKYKEDIVENGQVYELPTLKSTFLNIANEIGITVNRIRTRTLRNLLHKMWPEVRVISRPGLSSIVCSSDVSVEEALKVTCKLGKALSAISEEMNELPLAKTTSADHKDDDQILHRAAGIIRWRLEKVEKLEKQYFSSEEVSIEGQKKFVDEVLLKFLGWITSKQHFDSVSNVNEDKEQDPKLLALCCDLMFASTSVVTPKHLGLSVHLHHQYGSRKLIDELYTLGYTISYTELRHFLTSAAVHMTNSQRQTESGALVPVDIMHREQGGKLLIAAGDNWDLNEFTPDGKNTTHAMTTILISPKSNKKGESQRIYKVPDRTIDTALLPGGNLSSVLMYQKPSVRPYPYFSTPPTSKDEVRVPEPKAAQLLKLKELLYNLGRCAMFCDDRYESLPPWTVFQTQVTPDKLQEPSEVVFNPIIMSAPTHYNTVYTTLKRVKEQMNALGQSNCPVCFDMGLLTKALEVLWSKQSELDGVIPVEGGMHFLMSVFAGIGFLYGDAGLKELLSDSDVFASNTVKQILAGKDFDRGIRAFLMIDEVLNSRLLFNFQKWCESQNILFEQGHLKLHGDNMSDDLSFLESSVVPLLAEFRQKGREISPTFQFWDDYLRHVSTPFKLYLSSSRHALWEVYEYTKSQFLPFFFASNRTVYAKYMPYMVLSMQRLPADVKESFLNGSFVAKLTDGKFNSVWIDYCLEVTENKSLKSTGGIVGLTHRDGSLGRWFLSRPLTAKYSNTYALKGLNKYEKSSTEHHTNNATYKKIYDENIQKMKRMFEQVFLDPFDITDPPGKLVNFANGVSVSAEVEGSLLSCYTKGSDCLDKFVEERLVIPPGKQSANTNFYDPVPKVNTKTMSSKLKTVKCKSKDVPMNGEEMYIRLLAINSYKKVPLQRVMGFENAPVPLSIFTDSGDMMSTNKAGFMSKLEALVCDDVVPSVCNADCIIYDGMAVVQMLQQLNQSSTVYRDMVSSFWQYILLKSGGCHKIHVVFDRYLEQSAKSQTRIKRGEDQSGSKTFVIKPDMPVVDLKQALGNTSFKKELTKFYTIYLAQNSVDILSGGQTVVIGGGLGEKAISISSDLVSYVPELCTNQEEADTMILLHANYIACDGVQKLLIFSPDTYVLVLLVYHFNAIGIPYIFFQTGRKSVHTDMTRCIPIPNIVHSLSAEQLHVLLPAYCITGCDTCSSFFGIGKKSVFKLMMNKASQFESMGSLGDIPDLTSSQISSCTQFVGELYGKVNCQSLNALRAEKVIKNKHVKPRRLPPTDDSFLLHLQRCLFQLLVWKCALNARNPFPSLTAFGYTVDSESALAVPLLMTQPAAPPELLSDLVCSCGDVCETDCICASLEQPCTVACECKASVSNNGQCCRNIYTFLSTVE